MGFSFFFYKKTSYFIKGLSSLCYRYGGILFAFKRRSLVARVFYGIELTS